MLRNARSAPSPASLAAARSAPSPRKRGEGEEVIDDKGNDFFKELNLG